MSNDNPNAHVNPSANQSTQGHDASQKPHGGVFGDTAPIVEIAAHQVGHHLLEEGKEHQEAAREYANRGMHKSSAKESAKGYGKTGVAVGGMTAVGYLSGWAPWIVATGGWGAAALLAAAAVSGVAYLVQSDDKAN